MVLWLPKNQVSSTWLVTKRSTSHIYALVATGHEIAIFRKGNRLDKRGWPGHSYMQYSSLLLMFDMFSMIGILIFDPTLFFWLGGFSLSPLVLKSAKSVAGWHFLLTLLYLKQLSPDINNSNNMVCEFNMKHEIFRIFFDMCTS